MINPLQITYYIRTGYSPSDEPASDAVVELNESFTAPLQLKEYEPGHINVLRVQLSDEELHVIDYLKITDTVTNERWYYFVTGASRRLNEKTVEIGIMLDAFATVGLENISFFGNVARRSLSASERLNYPLLPEPWAPRRPLKTRRLVLDLNVNKTVKIPSHISTVFTEETTSVEDTQVINVPNSPLGLTTFQDSLAISAQLPMGYPNAAGDTTHSITTPWGNISYTTPFEDYLTLSGSTLATFLAKAKKYNSLDLIEPSYYLPAPNNTQTITLSELSNSNTRNLKASKYYTTVTIRSLASNSSHTYSDNDTDLQYNQSLTVVVVPDKNGGIYLLPTTIRDTGLSAYTYLEGVYSPFEAVVYNAVGDTPGKFAADGTLILNESLNNLFQTYINKVNALQVEGMQAKYFKDLGSYKNLVMPFAAEVLGVVTKAVSTVAGHWQNTQTSTNTPRINQTSSSSQYMPAINQHVTQNAYNPAFSQITNTLVGATNTAQNSTTNNPTRYQVQGSHTVSLGTNSQSYPAINTTICSHSYSTNGYANTPSHYQNSSTNIAAHYVNSSGYSNTPAHFVNTDTSSYTNAYVVNGVQNTYIPASSTVTETTQEGASRSVSEGNTVAVEGVPTVFELTDYGANAWNVLKTMIFGGYRNEIHSFMLGNINDYLNRWVSIQNDMHNGKVANLFKNITLLGNYTDYNKLVGKYEILIASLQPEDELNFDLFLDHFGHAVDECTETLVTDVRDNYNYVMVGEDAILSNSVRQDANAQILNQFRTGVRVWKKLVRPENY